MHPKPLSLERLKIRCRVVGRSFPALWSSRCCCRRYRRWELPGTHKRREFAQPRQDHRFYIFQRVKLLISKRYLRRIRWPKPSIRCSHHKRRWSWQAQPEMSSWRSNSNFGCSLPFETCWRKCMWRKLTHWRKGLTPWQHAEVTLCGSKSSRCRDLACT